MNATGITLSEQGEFVFPNGKLSTVFATKKGKRWQYRAEDGTLYGSGMEPAEFVRKFWLRDDFTA